MSRNRNFRKKIDDESDDEATSAVDRQRKTTAPKPKGPIVSFGEDDEDDDGGDIKLKKSKASKMFKKIRQAPIALPEPEDTKPSAYSSFGGSYSGESLEALRKQQNFAVASAAAVTVSDGVMEGLELGGEDAENMEVLTEKLEASKNISASAHFLTEVDERADQLALQTSRMYAAMRKNKESTERIVMTSKQIEKKDFVPLSSEDAEWEEELAKRAGVHRSKSTSSGRERDSGDLALESRATSLSARGTGTVSGAESVGSVFVDEIQQTVQKAIEALATGLDAADRKKLQLSEAREREKEEEKVLRAKVEQEVDSLNTMQMLRVFCSEVVGMLRDKEEMLQQLKEAALLELQSKGDLVRRRRVDDQEDILCKLKQSHELIDIGSYTPSASLKELDDILKEELETMHESVVRKQQTKKRKDELNARVHGRVVRRWRRLGLQVDEVKSVHSAASDIGTSTDTVTAAAAAGVSVVTVETSSTTSGLGLGAHATATSMSAHNEASITEVTSTSTDDSTRKSKSIVGIHDGSDGSEVEVDGEGEKRQSFSESEKAERLAELNAYYKQKPRRAGLGLGSPSAEGSGSVSKGGLGFVSAGGGNKSGIGAGVGASSAPRQMMFVAAGGSRANTLEECIHHTATAAENTPQGAGMHAVTALGDGSVPASDAAAATAGAAAAAQFHPPPPQPPKLSAAFSKFIAGSSSTLGATSTTTLTSTTTPAITQMDIDNETKLVSRDAELESDVDLSDDEWEHHAKKKRIVGQAAKVMMDDVRPEISSVSEILKKMSEFRSKLPKFYKASFISLSLPGIVEPLVLLDFIPLRLFDTDNSHHAHGNQENKNANADNGGGSSNSSSIISLADRDWHGSFVDFCTATEDPDKMDTDQGQNLNQGVNDNSDDTLLPRVVCSTLLPWVTSVISASLDPLSARACRRCADLMQELLEYDPTPQQLAEPLKAIVAAFERFFQSMCLPTVAVSGQLGRLFLRRQLSRATKCLQNVALFRSIVAAKAIAQIAWRLVSVQALKSSCLALGSQEKDLQAAATRLISAAVSILQHDSKDVTLLLESAAAAAHVSTIASAVQDPHALSDALKRIK